MLDGRLPAKHGTESTDITSALTEPTLVFRMLGHLDLDDGKRVLEIGTGSGYSAALLSARVGAANVTTVELDSGLAGAAVATLNRAGHLPAVIAADGTDGYPAGAPYDRMIATCGVRQVPYAWVEQTRPGGMIVLPYQPGISWVGALVGLTVREDGTAEGRFADPCGFMPLRGQRLPNQISRLVHHQDKAVPSTTHLDPAAIYDDRHAGFAVAARFPDWIGLRGPGAHPGCFTLWLFDLESGSWASVTREPGAEIFSLLQYGPRRLWHEVEDAYAWWDRIGRPRREDWVLTVLPDGQDLDTSEPR